MRTLIAITLGMLILLALSGCAALAKFVGLPVAMNAEDCAAANWTEMGYRDGAAGSVSELMKYQKECSEHQIIPNAEAYNASYDQGVKIYCTPKNGFQEGVSGNSYKSVCPKDLEVGFLARYRSGERIYDAEQQVSRLDREIADNERSQLDIETNINNEYAAKRPDRWRLQSLRNDLNSARHRVIDLRTQRSAAQRQLERVTMQETMGE